MSGTPDLTRVINLIMENPALIEEIAALAKKDNAREETDSTASPVAEAEAVSASAQVPSGERASEAVVATPRGRSPRNELLGALKPYLSNERAKAIDSMMTIADIFDMMREKQ